MTEYWTSEEIDRTGANYRIVYGERGPGKTYNFKKKAIDNWVDNGKQFAYIRRNDTEVKPGFLSLFWDDINDYLQERMRERYPAYTVFCVIAKTGSFRLYGYNENDVREEIATIGHYFALVNCRFRKSVPYPDVTLITYDEFMVDESKGEHELPNEFSTLINLISTIKRKRSDVVIYLLGNSVNRNSSLLAAMNINVRDVPQGAIKCYSYHDGDIVNTVAVEYTRHYEQASESEAFFVFNSKREMMIRDGSFEVDAYRQIEGLKEGQLPVMGFVFECESCRLYGYGMNDGTLWIMSKRWPRSVQYVTLTTGETRPSFGIFNWSFHTPRLNSLKERILAAVDTGMVRYDSDYTGDDFRHFLREVA